LTIVTTIGVVRIGGGDSAGTLAGRATSENGSYVRWHNGIDHIPALAAAVIAQATHSLTATPSATLGTSPDRGVRKQSSGSPGRVGVPNECH
jgi:hypothetical protein